MKKFLDFEKPIMELEEKINSLVGFCKKNSFSDSKISKEIEKLKKKKVN